LRSSFLSQANTKQVHWFATLLVTLSVLVASVAPARAQVATPTPAASLLAADPALVQLEAELLNEQVEGILARMSPADRVGQLFIITFAGQDTSFNSDIARLIYDYRIGGVVLSPRMMNFSNGKNIDTPRQVAMLVNQLQALAYGVLLPANQSLLAAGDHQWPPPGLVLLTSESGAPPPNVPLFVAVEQWGDGLPHSALRREFTPLPSQMALGATWNTDLVRKVGQIIGRELSAVGVNLLLGPNLDVFDQPRVDNLGALSLHTFGGNPYWVGQMGRAYIAGVHEGGNGRVATMARNFPGQGNIDRLPDQEIATVQLGLDELRQTALAPFRNVTRQTSLILRRTGELYTTDGLMTSHMRYNALPGRATPISLGPELSMTLDQEGFADWHNNGGILMSNAIGSTAIRRYYDPNLKEFWPRRVALDVFSAGHDLIYLDRLSLDENWATELQAIRETIGFFQERYTSDPDFAVQVDAAVRRLLRLKMRLYGPSYIPVAPLNGNGVLTPTTTLTVTALSTPTTATMRPLIAAPQVLVPEESMNVFTGTVRAEAYSVIGQVARESLTLLYPDVQNLPAALPTAPQAEDKLLIFSDSSRLMRECASCAAEAALGPDEIASIIIRLYGSEATGQVLIQNVESQTFSDLDQLLLSTLPEPVTAPAAPGVTATITVTTGSNPAPATIVAGLETTELLTQTAETLDKLARLEKLIDDSTWVIFAMLDVDTHNHASSDVVKRFLSQRSEELRGKNVIVLALNAPYYLDATEISKLTAYFGVYGKTRPFLESAVRAIFRSYTPVGAPPVSVPGTSYGSLSERLQPDRRQVDLRLLNGDTELTLEGEDNERPALAVGSVVRVRVGPVLDRNGRPVPDGTVVTFDVIYEGEALTLNIEPATTRNGVATREVPLERSGTLLVAANVGATNTGPPQAIGVLPPDPGEVAAVTPESTPMTIAAAITIPNSLTVSQPNQVANLFDADSLAATGRRVNAVTLVIALLTIMITLCLLLIAQVQILPRQVLMHNMLWATIFGLSAYILYGLGIMPGVELLQRRLDVLGPAVVVFIAMLLPLLWLQLRTEQLQ
jgi:beta-N-acetylhexosaminidase